MAPEDLAAAAWRAAVGKAIARHTVAVRLVRKHLIVEVEDQIWQRQLFSLREQLLAGLAKVVGEGVFEDIEIREAVTRLGPGRAGAREPVPGPAGTDDEAERIEDPVLRRNYIQARRRASA